MRTTSSRDIWGSNSLTKTLTIVSLKLQFVELPSFDCNALDDALSNTWRCGIVERKCTIEFQPANLANCVPSYNRPVPMVVNEWYKWRLLCNTTSPVVMPLNWPNLISDFEWPVIDARVQYTIESDQSKPNEYLIPNNYFLVRLLLSKSTVTQWCGNFESIAEENFVTFAAYPA